MKKPASPNLESLLGLFIGPTVWAVYYLLAYLIAAIWCAKHAPADGSLGAAKAGILALAALALTLIALNAWRGLHHTYRRQASPPHDRDTPEDRHRFLGFASLLLSTLAGVATIFVTLPLLLSATCH